jgi:flagellar protein FlaG
MGFSLTGTHVILFIASVIVAGAVSGVLIGVTTNVTTSFSNRGDRLQEQLATDFKIINDPNAIPNAGGYYKFYIKNIGDKRLITTNETFQLFVDGDLIAVANYYFSDDYVQPGNIATMYVANSEISSGDHTLRAVGPLAIEDKFTFTI